VIACFNNEGDETQLLIDKSWEKKEEQSRGEERKFSE
jgi:hypothetical protein